MDCSVCGSQDTVIKRGISKAGKNKGLPWTAYDCNEPQCKNEKGYPSRTFVNTPKPKLNAPIPQSNGDIVGLHRKLDAIMKHLNISLIIADPIRNQVADEETPF